MSTDPPRNYDAWYPDVAPIEDSKQLADLLGTSDQIIRGVGTRPGPSIR